MYMLSVVLGDFLGFTDVRYLLIRLTKADHGAAINGAMKFLFVALPIMCILYIGVLL